MITRYVTIVKVSRYDLKYRKNLTVTYVRSALPMSRPVSVLRQKGHWTRYR